ncbi:MAG: DNA repair protein RecO [Treponema sp.]|nr:DNA repair protein RecO [Treponema sp.]
MGERNKTTNAVILNLSRQGENNWTVTLLSPDCGIFYATLYGGPKSKLRSLVQKFNIGQLFYYDDSQRNLRKISDFDVAAYHPTFSTDIYKIWAANLGAELVIKTKAAGDWENTYTLLCAFLNGIDACDEKGARLGTIRFLWRYLKLLGIQPDTSYCVSCSSPLSESHYFPAMNGFLCTDCISSYTQSKENMNQALPISKNAIGYLTAINEQTPGKVRAMTISANDAYDLKKLVYILAEQAAGSRLKTLESGSLIL